MSRPRVTTGAFKILNNIEIKKILNKKIFSRTFSTQEEHKINKCRLFKWEIKKYEGTRKKLFVIPAQNIFFGFELQIMVS